MDNPNLVAEMYNEMKQSNPYMGQQIQDPRMGAFPDQNMPQQQGMPQHGGMVQGAPFQQPPQQMQYPPQYHPQQQQQPQQPQPQQQEMEGDDMSDDFEDEMPSTRGIPQDHAFEMSRFGMQEVSKSWLDTLLDSLRDPIIIAILFFALSLPQVNRFLIQTIPAIGANLYYNLGFKGVLMAGLFLLVTWFLDYN